MGSLVLIIFSFILFYVVVIPAYIINVYGLFSFTFRYIRKDQPLAYGLSVMAGLALGILTGHFLLDDIYWALTFAGITGISYCAIKSRRKHAVAKGPPVEIDHYMLIGRFAVYAIGGMVAMCILLALVTLMAIESSDLLWEKLRGTPPD